MSSEIKVERSSHSSLPFPAPDMGYWTTVHTTRLTDGANKTFTGTGWTSEEADRAAGEKMNRGEKD